MLDSSREHGIEQTRGIKYQLAIVMTRSSWGNYHKTILKVAMAMKMALGANPRPDRVPKQELSNPWSLFTMAAELCIVFVKIFRQRFLHPTFHHSPWMR